MFIIYVGGGGGQIRGGGAKSFTPSQGGGGVMTVLRVVRGGGHKSLTLPAGRHFFGELRIVTLYVDRTSFPSDPGTEIAQCKTLANTNLT